MLDNKTIIAILRRVITFLTLHDEDLVQIKHYTEMSFFFENTPYEVMALSAEARKQVTGMRDETLGFIEALAESGTCQLLSVLEAKTPAGVLELLQVRGLGPNKVRTLWQEAGITSLVALKEACEKQVLEGITGFGKKTQAAILQDVEDQESYKEFVHYSTALQYATTFQTAFQAAFPTVMISITGDLRRKMEVISSLHWLIATNDKAVILQWLQQCPLIVETPALSGPFAFRGVWKENNLNIELLFCHPVNFYQQLVLQTGNTAHLARVIGAQTFGACVAQMRTPTSEDAIYQAANLPTIPPELREGLVEESWIKDGASPLLTLDNLQGILHVHTAYSDGQHSLEEMAMRCKEMGYQYMGITDHSQTAVYAGGLSSHQVYQQHQHVDALNQQLAPFKIFKGIESDILPDGSLDYPDEVLAQFDFLIVSIHNGFNMTEKAATDRLITAISNPYTTILGHLTGRLLLRRRGYLVDHHAIIDACAAYGVAIEINAHPWRLDLDWRWVPYALQKGVQLSINPDAHSKADFDNMIYGVEVARKGGLTQANTLNALSATALTAWLKVSRSRSQTQ